MDLGELDRELSRAGIKLSANGEDLRVRAPKGALTAELRQALKANKAELLLRLRNVEASGRPASVRPAT